MEAHDEGVIGPYGRRPERAAAAEDEPRDLVVSGVGEVELEQLLALRDPDLLGLTCQRERLVAAKLDLVGDDVLGKVDIFWSQELLGALTARSRAAVVVPANLHNILSVDAFVTTPPDNVTEPTAAAAATTAGG